MLSITAFVLAIFAPLAVGIGLLTYVQSALSRLRTQASESSSSHLVALTNSYSQLSERVNKLESAIAQTSSTHLAGEVAAIAGDLESLAKSCRKQFGKLFAEAHHDGQLARNGSRQLDIEHDSADPEFASLIAFQSAPAPAKEQ